MERIPCNQSYYEIFVGHLPLQTSDDELHQLFKGCGEIVGLQVPKVSSENEFRYGFVRFCKKESALSAVAQMHRWSFKGLNIVVEIAHSTKIQLEQERKEEPTSCGINVPERTTQKPQRSTIHKRNLRIESTCTVQNVLNFSRLKETCNNLNLELMKGAGSKGHERCYLDKDLLVGDIEKCPYSREPSYVGDYDDSQLDFEKIEENLSNGITHSTGSSFGEERAKQFTNALKNIMNIVNKAPNLKSHLDELHISEDLEEDGDEFPRPPRQHFSQVEYQNKFEDEEAHYDINATDKHSQEESKNMLWQLIQTVGRGRGLSTTFTRNIPQVVVGRGQKEVPRTISK